MDEDHPVVLVLRASGSDPVLARLQLSTGNRGVEEHDSLPYLPLQVFVVVPIWLRCEGSLGRLDQLGFASCGGPTKEEVFGRQLGRHGRFFPEDKGLLLTNGNEADVALNGTGAAIVALGLYGTVVVIHTHPCDQLRFGDGD